MNRHRRGCRGKGSAAAAFRGMTREDIVKPGQIALIRTSFAKVQPRMDELGSVFYARLFATKPELRELFPQDMGRVKARLHAAAGNTTD